jgi:hypothetical protein
MLYMPSRLIILDRVIPRVSRDISILKARSLLTLRTVMYIPAVPLTPQNQAYVERQKAAFLQGQRPPDFPKGTGEGEAGYVGIASVDDVISKEGRRAMGLVEVGA